MIGAVATTTGAEETEEGVATVAAMVAAVEVRLCLGISKASTCLVLHEHFLTGPYVLGSVFSRRSRIKVFCGYRSDQRRSCGCESLLEWTRLTAPDANRAGGAIGPEAGMAAGASTKGRAAATEVGAGMTVLECQTGGGTPGT